MTTNMTITKQFLQTILTETEEFIRAVATKIAIAYGKDVDEVIEIITSPTKATKQVAEEKDLVSKEDPFASFGFSDELKNVLSEWVKIAQDAVKKCGFNKVKAAWPSTFKNAQNENAIYTTLLQMLNDVIGDETDPEEIKLKVKENPDLDSIFDGLCLMGLDDLNGKPTVSESDDETIDLEDMPTKKPLVQETPVQKETPVQEKKEATSVEEKKETPAQEKKGDQEKKVTSVQEKKAKQKVTLDPDVFETEKQFTLKCKAGLKMSKYVDWKTGAFVQKTEANEKKYSFSPKGFAVLKKDKEAVWSSLTSMF